MRTLTDLGRIDDARLAVEALQQLQQVAAA
jgi:hypothetical protein